MRQLADEQRGVKKRKGKNIAKGKKFIYKLLKVRNSYQQRKRVMKQTKKREKEKNKVLKTLS